MKSHIEARASEKLRLLAMFLIITATISLLTIKAQSDVAIRAHILFSALIIFVFHLLCLWVPHGHSRGPQNLPFSLSNAFIEELTVRFGAVGVCVLSSGRG